jgi:hypothetical protein
MNCLLCRSGLEHCHEALVLHIDGSFDCIDAECVAGEAGHDWVVSCLDYRWPCDCDRTGHVQPLAA